MRTRIAKRDCWIHVFEKSTFGGKAKLLGSGERESVEKIGSVIVGPKAVAEILDANGQQIMGLPQRKLVEDFAKYVSNRQVSCIRVAKAPSHRPIKSN